MRTLLSRATQVDPSFNVGLGLVVIIAVAEIFAVTSYYVGRSRPPRDPAQALTTTVPPSMSVGPALRGVRRRQSRRPSPGPRLLLFQPRQWHRRRLRRLLPPKRWPRRRRLLLSINYCEKAPS